MPKFCSECGSELIDENIKFCQNCGSEVNTENISQSNSGTTYSCPYCGKTIPYTDKCPYCRRILQNNDAEKCGIGIIVIFLIVILLSGFFGFLLLII